MGGLRAIVDGSAPDAVAAIDRMLADVEREDEVTIALAIESGSRAWGFASHDSDYDCRFIFVRPLAAYLTPWPRRDVIERPLEGDLDVNGWDLVKTLKLMLKGNAVVLEWLRSPFAYAGDAAFRDGLSDLARRWADRDLVARHYLHLGERQRRTYFPDGQAVAIKKLFYALRPAAALRWLRLRGEAVPPMHFPTLMAECAPPDEVAAATAVLLEAKARTRELGSAAVPRAIGAFIDEEFALAQAALGGRTAKPPLEARTEAERFFRETVLRFDA